MVGVAHLTSSSQSSSQYALRHLQANSSHQSAMLISGIANAGATGQLTLGAFINHTTLILKEFPLKDTKIVQQYNVPRDVGAVAAPVLSL